MQVFIVAVSFALVVSFMCSIFESVLLSLSHAQVELLATKGKQSGRILKAFKERIDIPISAILITNTAAHTVDLHPGLHDCGPAVHGDHSQDAGRRLRAETGPPGRLRHPWSGGRTQAVRARQ